MSNAPIERRAAPRARAGFPLRLSPTGQAQPAVLRDISTNGLCCDFGEPIADMTLLKVQVELPGSGAQELRGVVVRCDKRRGASPPTYEVAIYFTEIATPTRKAIQEYVLAHHEPGGQPAPARRT